MFEAGRGVFVAGRHALTGCAANSMASGCSRFAFAASGGGK
jgi:hypothetical protein